MHAHRNSPIFLLTYRCVLKYVQTELGLSTSLTFCVCMLCAFVIWATFSFSSLCARTLGTVPQCPVPGPEYVLLLTALFFQCFNSIFSLKMYIIYLSVLSYWSCILLDVLKHSSFLLVYSGPRRLDPGWLPTGTFPALYCNWLVARRPQWEHRFSHCPDLTSDFLERPITVFLSLFLAPIPPLSISWKVLCICGQGLCLSLWNVFLSWNEQQSCFHL